MPEGLFVLWTSCPCIYQAFATSWEGNELLDKRRIDNTARVSQDIWNLPAFQCEEPPTHPAARALQHRPEREPM
jgi:hypothetical protein